VLSHGLVALVSLGIGAAAGGNPSSQTGASATPAPTVTVTRTVTATAAAAPTGGTGKSGGTAASGTNGSDSGQAPAVSVPGDGEYNVGTDMQPGTYRTKGPADGTPECYWERDKDSSGSFNSIIANDNLAGSGLVTVAKGEIFKSQGCQTWTKTG
jgi:hypothetical protein